MFTTLRSKIIAGFGAIITVNLLFTVWSLYQSHQAGQAIAATIAEEAQRSVDASDALQLLRRHYAVVTSLSLDASSEDSISVLRQRLRFHLNRFLLPADTVEPASPDHDITTSYTEYEASAREIRGDRRNGVAVDRDRLAELAERYASLTEGIARSGSTTGFDVDRMRAVIARRSQDNLVAVGFATIIVAVIAVIGGAVYSRYALNSIDRLRQAVKNVGSGELTQRIHITTADELGDLSYEFNRMIEQLNRYETMNVERLLLEQRKAETIVSSMTTPIILVDDAMEIVSTNAAALRLFRRDITDDVRGTPLADLIDDRELRARLTSIEDEGSRPLRADTIPWSIEVEGSERFFAIQTHRPDPVTGTGGTVFVFIDVTEIRALDRMKSDLLARISHEFRTPLSSILMSVDLMKEGIVGPITDEQNELLANAKVDCRRLSGMINDILEMSRIEAIDAYERVELIDVRGSMEEILETHRRIAREKGVRMDVTIDPSIDDASNRFVGDVEHLRLIVNNLLSNAIRHTRSGGVVSLEMIGGESLTIRVSDDGEGIPLDSVDRVFDRFYQVERGGELTPGSIGLGLSIVKEIAEKYNGSVGVESRINEGSIFTVSLPMTSSGEEGDATETKGSGS